MATVTAPPSPAPRAGGSGAASGPPPPPEPAGRLGATTRISVTRRRAGPSRTTVTHRDHESLRQAESRAVRNDNSDRDPAWPGPAAAMPATGSCQPECRGRPADRRTRTQPESESLPTAESVTPSPSRLGWPRAGRGGPGAATVAAEVTLAAASPPAAAGPGAPTPSRSRSGAGAAAPARPSGRRGRGPGAAG